MSNFHGPWLVDVVAALVSIAALAVFLKFWQPKRIWRFPGEEVERESGVGGQDSGDRTSGESERQRTKSANRNSQSEIRHSRSEILRAWLPWIILSVVVFVWGLPQTKAFLDGFSLLKIAVPGLDKLVLRVPPVVAKPTAENAVFNFNWLSASGSGILLASIIAGRVMGYSISGLARVYWKTLKLVRFSLLTIAAMMAIGFTTRYSGMDATLGLAFAKTGFLYPFFGTMLGWLGVALTGSDTSSNVLFGSLQKITAGTTWPQSDADGGGQQFRRRHGQDDRRAINRRGQHRHALVRPRRRHPALCLFSQPGAGRAGWPAGFFQAYVFTSMVVR